MLYKNGHTLVTFQNTGQNETEAKLSRSYSKLLLLFQIMLLEPSNTADNFKCACEAVSLFTMCTLNKIEVKYFISGMFRSILNRPIVSFA